MATNRSVGETLNKAIAKADGLKEPRQGRPTSAGGFQTGWKVARPGDDKVYDKFFIVVTSGKVKLHSKPDGQDAAKCLAAADSTSFDQIRNKLKKHFGINLPTDWHA